MTPTNQQDQEILRETLKSLLDGTLQVGAGVMRVVGPLKRQGSNKEWMVAAINEWLEQNEDAIILLTGLAGDSLKERLRQALNK